MYKHTVRALYNDYLYVCKMCNKKPTPSETVLQYPRFMHFVLTKNFSILPTHDASDNDNIEGQQFIPNFQISWSAAAVGWRKTHQQSSQWIYEYDTQLLNSNKCHGGFCGALLHAPCSYTLSFMSHTMITLHHPITFIPDHHVTLNMMEH